MADARLTQASFSAGEISPELYARQDLAKYQVGCRLLENFYVLAYGGVQNRSGLRYMAEVKDSTKTVKLAKFEAAGDQAYLMEMGEEYFRYFYRGGVVLDGLDISETVTPYQEEDLWDLYTAQSNDVMTITSQAYPVNELSNVSDGVWELDEVDFTPSITAPSGLTATATFGVSDPDDIGYDKNPKKYRYKVSSLTEDGEESTASAAVLSDVNTVLGFEKNFIDLDWNPRTGADTYNVYKDQNGVFGYIGFTDGTDFRDNNYLPDLTRGTVSARNPFNAANRYPALCGFCQQRRVFADTINKPQSIWMSVSANFDSMQISKPARDDDAIEFALAANQKQDILHLVSAGSGMIVFTRSGEWVVTGREGDVITPSSIFPKPQSSYGAHDRIRPIIAGEQILFVPASGALVYEMEYNIQVDRYKAANLALLSNHLFKGREIVSWDFAERPHGIIWVVMDDGEMLSLTYLKEHDVWGWARHSTKGAFLDVCVVPEGGYDTPYFLVERRVTSGVKKYIEYLPQRDFQRVEECFFLDCGLSYENSASVSATATHIVTNHTFAAGDEFLVEGLTFTDLEGNVTYDLSGRYLVETVLAGPTRYVVTDTEGGAVDLATAYNSGDLQATDALAFKAISTLTNLDHLEGRAISVLADGNVIDGLTVDSGEVDLGDPYYRIHAGLAYSSTFYSLDIVNPQQDAKGIAKATGRAIVQVDKSRGFSVGTTPDDVEEYDTRIDEAWGEPGALISKAVEVEPQAGWEIETTVAVVQTYPLPLTIMSVSPEITYGG